MDQLDLFGTATVGKKVGGDDHLFVQAGDPPPIKQAINELIAAGKTGKKARIFAAVLRNRALAGIDVTEEAEAGKRELLASKAKKRVRKVAEAHVDA